MTGLLLVCLVSDQAWMSSSSALAHEDKSLISLAEFCMFVAKINF